jgi:hypothetical protein
MHAEKFVLPVVQDVVARCALDLARDGLSITSSTFHDQAPLIGAAARAFEALFRRTPVPA